jgi:hypothetical protein
VPRGEGNGRGTAPLDAHEVVAIARRRTAGIQRIMGPPECIGPPVRSMQRRLDSRAAIALRALAVSHWQE